MHANIYFCTGYECLANFEMDSILLILKWIVLQFDGREGRFSMSSRSLSVTINNHNHCALWSFTLLVHVTSMCLFTANQNLNQNLITLLEIIYISRLAVQTSHSENKIPTVITISGLHIFTAKIWVIVPVSVYIGSYYLRPGWVAFRTNQNSLSRSYATMIVRVHDLYD